MSCAKESAMQVFFCRNHCVWLSFSAPYLPSLWNQARNICSGQPFIRFVWSDPDFQTITKQNWLLGEYLGESMILRALLQETEYQIEILLSGRWLERHHILLLFPDRHDSYHGVRSPFKG